MKSTPGVPSFYPDRGCKGNMSKFNYSQQTLQVGFSFDTMYGLSNPLWQPSRNVKEGRWLDTYWAQSFYSYLIKDLSLYLIPFYIRCLLITLQKDCWTCHSSKKNEAYLLNSFTINGMPCNPTICFLTGLKHIYLLEGFYILILERMLC